MRVRRDLIYQAAVRVFMLALCFISFQRALTGVTFYQGERAFKRGNFMQAAESFKRIQSRDGHNPHFVYLMGQSAWNLGIQLKKESWFKTAEENFKQLTQEMPYYGKGWMYLALSRLYGERQFKKQGVTRKKWSEIKPLLLKAVEAEPASAWMSYNFGIQFLSYDSLISDPERALALDQMEKSFNFRFLDPFSPYLEKPSPYLEQGIEFLWQHFHDLSQWKSLVPEDLSSYQVFLDFADKNDLWKYRQEIYPVYLNLQKAAYELQCQKGEAFLSKRDFNHAFLAFRKAFWMRSWAYKRAKAGILIAQEGLNQLPEGEEELWKQDVRETVEAILEEEDEEIGKNIFEGLKEVVNQTGDGYLIGLYALRMNDFALAQKRLEESFSRSESYRRYLAQAYLGNGETASAFRILKPVLDEKQPDLRELLFLTEKDSPYKQQALEKIQQITTSQLPADAWWGGGTHSPLISDRGRVSVQVNLRPGQAGIHIPVRSLPGVEGDDASIVIRLNEREAGGAFIEYGTTQEVTVPVRTSGGRRWLVVEVLNRSENAQESRGPIIELGSVDIVYS